MKTLAIRNRTTGREVGKQIGCADTQLTRIVGLLGRSRLDAGGGIWIIPSSGVHTFGMRFPIDVVGLDRRLRIVRLWANVRPNRVPGISIAVHSVLELAAGEIERCSLGIGHELEFHSEAPVL